MIDVSGTTISIVIDGKEKKFDINKIFDIDEEDLTREFTSQATIYAYFATALAKADYDASIATMEEEQTAADADQVYREQLTSKGEKYTEGVIKSMVQQDEEHQEAVKNELAAKYDARLLKAITTALEMRAQMLISVGSHIRHELDMTGMNIRERQFTKTVDDAKEVMRSRKSR